MVRPGFPVPKDEIEVGAGQRCWVNCVFYGTTIEEVIEKRRKYFEAYDPRGYDTQSDNVYHHPDGYYQIKIRRWSTCS